MDTTSEVQTPTLRPASCAEPPGCLALGHPAGLSGQDCLFTQKPGGGVLCNSAVYTFWFL